MALKINTKILRQSRDGRDIVAVDSTGLESLGRVTGYGSNNGEPEDILAHHFVISRYNSVSKYKYTVGSVVPEGVPTNVELANGHPIHLKTEMFKSGSNTDSTQIFADGVLDFNMYVEFQGISGVVITEGLNYIVYPEGVVGNLNPILEYDSVAVGGKIYELDKSKDTNGGTVIYIIDEFESSATSFNVLYRVNTKILLNTVAKYYHAFATKKLKNSLDNPDWEKVNTALSFIKSSELWFDDEDYAESHDEIIAANKLLRRFAC